MGVGRKERRPIQRTWKDEKRCVPQTEPLGLDRVRNTLYPKMRFAIHEQRDAPVAQPGKSSGLLSRRSWFESRQGCYVGKHVKGRFAFRNANGEMGITRRGRPNTGT